MAKIKARGKSTKKKVSTKPAKKKAVKRSVKKKGIKKLGKKALKATKGGTAVEYAVMLGLIIPVHCGGGDGGGTRPTETPGTYQHGQNAPDPG